MSCLLLETRTRGLSARCVPSRNVAVVCTAIATSSKLHQLQAYDVPTSCADAAPLTAHQWLQDGEGLDQARLSDSRCCSGISAAAAHTGSRHPFLRWLRERGHPLPHNARCGCQEACTHQHGLGAAGALSGCSTGGLADELAAEGLQVAILDTFDAGFQCQSPSQGSSQPDDSPAMCDGATTATVAQVLPDGKAQDNPFDFMVLYGLSLPNIGILHQLRSMLHPFGALCCEVPLERCSRSHTPAAAVASVVNQLHDAGMTVTSWELLSGVPSGGAAGSGGRLRLVAVQAF